MSNSFHLALPAGDIEKTEKFYTEILYRLPNSFLCYSNGIDAFVTKFSSSGNSLVGSTYIGGSGNDGINVTGLVANYADEYRGEIIIDSTGNCWVATSTTSTDFPLINPVQNNNGGNQDVVVFKLNNKNHSLIIYADEHQLIRVFNNLNSIHHLINKVLQNYAKFLIESQNMSVL